MDFFGTPTRHMRPIYNCRHCGIRFTHPETVTKCPACGTPVVR